MASDTANNGRSKRKKAHSAHIEAISNDLMVQYIAGKANQLAGTQAEVILIQRPLGLVPQLCLIGHLSGVIFSMFLSIGRGS
ncbi:uncharacterized protein N7479_008116 [Penicillium vulpinum]|uniref:uncharacterized protein n=1 Tax=Penicillium vulpinum TaxID=29845 RepID=UPI002546DB3D|nr:uncharacterized protein N7479_008116 [Penicillium vulpinum]KAJ5960966.1 hypothetical protein N7479_008116 [Penicillium vulpinum]